MWVLQQLLSELNEIFTSKEQKKNTFKAFLNGEPVLILLSTCFWQKLKHDGSSQRSVC